ncbi:hypothetical protein BCR42DRAFT_398775 [Absidia repens]|uniref:Uncharacterized protein n=1 Tax=Absidia repens TaxID=90262 RepID=A0A1X2HX44_9FUNG|nr:hypothetical protein BCR42DRAFT_398775 [Absidia repens]
MAPLRSRHSNGKKFGKHESLQRLEMFGTTDEGKRRRTKNGKTTHETRSTKKKRIEAQIQGACRAFDWFSPLATGRCIFVLPGFVRERVCPSGVVGADQVLPPRGGTWVTLKELVRLELYCSLDQYGNSGGRYNARAQTIYGYHDLISLFHVFEKETHLSYQTVVVVILFHTIITSL